MDYITSKQDIIDFLRELFKTFNYELYNGALPDPVIDVGVLLGNQRSRYKPGVWSDAKGRLPEIMFSGALFERASMSIDDISIELLHCMVHQYCDEKGIKDTSCQGNYHNKRFKQVAESHGLTSATGGKGYNVQSDYYLSESLKENHAYKRIVADFFIKRERYTNCLHKTGRVGHSIKYVCSCGKIIRSTSTKEVNAICKDCWGDFRRANKT